MVHWHMVHWHCPLNVLRQFSTALSSETANCLCQPNLCSSPIPRRRCRAAWSTSGQRSSSSNLRLATFAPTPTLFRHAETGSTFQAAPPRGTSSPMPRWPTSIHLGACHWRQRKHCMGPCAFLLVGPVILGKCQKGMTKLWNQSASMQRRCPSGRKWSGVKPTAEPCWTGRPWTSLQWSVWRTAFLT